MAKTQDLTKSHHVDETVTVQPRPRLRWIPQFLLSEALYLFFFRLTLALSVLAIMLLLWMAVQVAKLGQKSSMLRVLLVILGAVVMTLHHIGAAFGPLRFPLAVWLDISLTVGELAGCIVFAILVSESGAYFYSAIVLVLVVAWSLTASVGILLLLKLARLLEKRSLRSLRGLVEVSGPPDPQAPWWKYPAQALFGGMWEESLPGESVVLSLLRVLLAWSAVFALLGFGVHQTIILPNSDSGKIPMRTYRSAGIGLDTIADIDNNLSGVEFKVLLVWVPHIGSTANLTDAVTATAHWKVPSSQSASSPLYAPAACDVKTAQGSIDPLILQNYETAIVICPRSPNQVGDAPSPWWDFPNFDIRVNYTGIMGTGPPLADRVGDSVRVYLGLTKDMNRVFKSTEPVSMFPGTNMLSIANLVVRLRLGSEKLAMLGFESREGFLVASIAQTIPNFRAGPDSIYDPQIATLGFTLQNVVNEWTLVEDYQGRSVISGLSAFGGLGSFLSTLLGILLGTSLVQVFARTRPSSPFGLLHSIGTLRNEMVDKCEKRYPALKEDLARIEKEQGLFAFLFKALIDVEPLRSELGVAAQTDTTVAESPLRGAREGTVGEEGGMGGRMDREPEDASETDELMQEKSAEQIGRMA